MYHLTANTLTDKPSSVPFVYPVVEKTFAQCDVRNC